MMPLNLCSALRTSLLSPFSRWEIEALRDLSWHRPSKLMMELRLCAGAACTCLITIILESEQGFALGKCLLRDSSYSKLFFFCYIFLLLYIDWQSYFINSGPIHLELHSYSYKPVTNLLTKCVFQRVTQTQYVLM